MTHASERGLKHANEDHDDVKWPNAREVRDVRGEKVVWLVKLEEGRRGRRVERKREELFDVLGAGRDGRRIRKRRKEETGKIDLEKT